MIYEQLKKEVETDCSKLIETYEAAKRKLNLLRKRKTDAESQLTSLKEQKERLTSLKDASIGDSVNAFEKFTVSLKKSNSQIEALSEAVGTLSTKIIPEAEKEVNRTATELRLSLRSFCIASAKTITGEMNGLLEKVVERHDEQFSATQKIYSDYGLMPLIADDGIYVTNGSGIFIPKNNRITGFRIIPASKFVQVQPIENKPIQKSPPPIVATVSPTQPEKLKMPKEEIPIEKQVDAWVEGAFGKSPDPTPLEIINPDAGDEAGNAETSEKPEVTVEAAGDTTEKI
jgi:uncharacterized protein YukE